MKVVKQANLIFSDVISNRNKFYRLYLYEDCEIKSSNGRIGVTEILNELPKIRGESGFQKQLNSKLKKGYTELRTVSSFEEGKVVSVAKSDLSSIARSQIKTNKPELEKLIDRLVQANIHTITSSTSLKYNDITGLFSTPLGILLPEAVKDARDILIEINSFVENQDYSNKLSKLASQYFSIVPTSLGMKKPDLRAIFPDKTAVQKQNDILDSLDASYLAIGKTPSASLSDNIEEKVFDVELDILQDVKERGRLEGNFYKTNKSMHGYSRVKVREIYKVDIKEFTNNFNAKISNIRDVYHGSSQSNCLSILKSGLKISPPSTAKIAGKLFGLGAYFSQTSSKSMGYTFSKWGQGGGDMGYLFVCKVAMGKPYYPNTYGINSIPSGYDSCWALPEKTGLLNDELIVFKESQIKIEYLLEIK